MHIQEPFKIPPAVPDAIAAGHTDIHEYLYSARKDKAVPISEGIFVSVEAHQKVIVWGGWRLYTEPLLWDVLLQRNNCRRIETGKAMRSPWNMGKTPAHRNGDE